MQATVLIDKIASKYSVAQSLLVAIFIFLNAEIFFGKNFFVNLQTRISTFFSNNNLQICGRIFRQFFYLPKCL